MASSSSSVLRLIHRRALASSFKWIRYSSSSSLFKSGNFDLFNTKMSTSSVKLNPSVSKKSSSPLLMIPPDASDLKFYSLAENIVVNMSVEKEISDLLPNLDFKGSSHGWLALFNPYNLDLFLYNPISRRRVNLPPIRTLPDIPDENLEGGYGCVVKVVLSCSPDDPEQDCRAMMSYYKGALAFCCPGKSDEWTPIGDIYGWDNRSFDNSRDRMYARSYNRFVYSNTQRAFFCLTRKPEMETWNLRDPKSPKMRMTPIYKPKKELDKDYDFYSEPKPYYAALSHLVLVDDSELLLVDQHVTLDDCYVNFMGESSEKCPHKTVDFEVFKYDREGGDFKVMDSSSLGGLAIFIGFYSHPMVLSTSEFHELKPNSIYFTDPVETPSKRIDNDDRWPCNGHDIGIFDCQDKTFSSCYYPCDIGSIKKIVPSPMWFFPSPI